MKPTRLALRDSIRIFEVANQLVAIVVGNKPTGCPGPRLCKARAGCFDLACECGFDCRGPAAERYFIVQPIQAFLKVGEIRVRHADGIDSHRIQNVDSQSEMLAERSEMTPILGFSQNFSLEAAFKDALKKLDPSGLKEPSLVEVVSLGALYGGFSGFSRMFVRVETRHDLSGWVSRKNRQGLT
jgi:hypothetical protein